MRYHHFQFAIKICIATSLFFQIVKSEFYTAIADLEKLLGTEEEIVKTLETYLKVEERRIQKLRRINEQYAKLFNSAKNDAERFLSNPVNSYVLLKHLTTDWKAATNLIQDSESRELLNNLTSLEVNFPNEEDLNGAAAALLRLQHMYSLDTSEIAKGQIKGTRLSLELTAADCFELGKQAFNFKYPKYTLLWMHESLKRLEREEVKTIDKIRAMEYIAYSAYDVGNFTLGLGVMEDIIQQYPDFPRISANLHYYQIKLRDWQNRQQSVQTDAPKKLQNINGKDYDERELLKMYNKLCKGESIKTAKEKSKLHCHYTTNNNSYLLLQPVKVEVLHFNPRLVMFHEIISDAEIQVIKELAFPKLERAIVQNSDTGEQEASTFRISKSTLLRNNEHELLPKINKRIEAITGLSTEYSEPLHVINYGIGGHYDPHLDFAQGKHKLDLFPNLGNRIATWIFYLSDVPAKGSTVFPVIGVEVKPVKGAAAFWYNLYKNGEGDENTLHAACPVLAGSKWVSNKWLHELGQEFRRPCSLDPTE